MAKEMQGTRLALMKHSPSPTAKQIILFVMYCLPVVTIPFLIFYLLNKKPSKATRDAKNIIYLTIAASTSIFTSFVALYLYLLVYSPDITSAGLGPVPEPLWLLVTSSINPFALIFVLSIIFAIATNRLAMNLLGHEESQFRPRNYTFWEKIEFYFKWKNERTTLASGNETLMKVKNAAAFYMVTVLLILLGTIAMVMLDVDLMAVLKAIATGEGWDDISTMDTILSAVYAIIIGFPFIIANLMLWFYTGRLFCYQAQHYLRKGKRVWLWIKITSYAISIEPFLLLALSVSGIFPMFSIATSIILSFMSIMCWVVIIIQFRKDPANMVLDPRNLTAKIAKGMLVPSRGGFKDPSLKQDRIKKWCFGFLVVCITGISAINASIWFPATIMYAQVVSWYESGFYFWIGMLMVVGPVILLFFLDTVYTRRLLMGYLVIILLVTSVVTFENLPFLVEFSQVLFSILFNGRVAYTNYVDRLTTGERPAQVILVLMVAILSFAAFYVVKRKALPIPIRTRKHPGGWSSLKNLRAFFFMSNRKQGTRTNIAMVAFLVMITGIFITFEPPVTVVLPRPADHQMRVSFWDSGFDLPGSTLDLLSSHDIRLYGWYNYYDVAGAQYYANHSLEVVPVCHMPKSTAELQDLLAFIGGIMDFWDINNLYRKPFIGFTFDHEEMRGVRYFNETEYRDMVTAVGNFTDYVTSRGYEVFSTTYLMPIGDLLDGDADVSIDNFDPFDPTWNVTHFDWMVYRTEIAIEYDESSAYFTYEWARYIKHFMLNLGGPSLFAKASMSIGVTSDELPLYRDPNGLDEFMLDVKICHAMEIPEIKIFYLGNPDGGTFLGKWGNDGIERLVCELQNYTQVAVPFKRRATFLGNLKGAENPTGSIFGFIFQDFWLEEWMSIVPWIWIIFLLVIPLVTLRIRFTSEPKYNPRKRPHQRNALDRALIFARIALFALICFILGWVAASFINPSIFDW